MAKVKNPLFSFGASGSVASLLTINQSLTAPTARRKPTGSRPASHSQAVMRADMHDAATLWATLDAPTRATWAALAAPRATTPFAKYFKEWRAQASTISSPPYIPMA